MANISKQKRDKMIGFLEYLKSRHSDDESIKAIKEIESALLEKKYGLVWEEHTEHVDEMMKDHIPVFVEDKEKEIISDSSLSYNFLLEGDNLHSLKLLEKTHRGKIDIIYIDPPYNRGKDDFIYDDNYIIKEDSYRHSKWMSFMEKRLKIAQKLLSSSGLIFLSIDDNEFAPLKMLCDEIFGEHNFINIFVWQRNSSAKTEKGKFTVNTEYVLLYAKSDKYILNDAYKPLSESSLKLFKFDDKDGRGKYQTVSLQKPKNPGPETTYDYIDNTGKIWPCPPKGWRMKKEKIKALENDNRLLLTGRTLRVKDYWNERINEGKRIDTLWNDLAQNTAGSGELTAILGKSNVFNNPKPTDLIIRCLKIADKNAVVLDFFAGSGTTGHAVLKLNKEDGGNRKFILCTNNENNICEEITYERIKRVINGYSDIEGLPANLKYYKTGFITRYPEENSLSDLLLDHIKEMVQLENAINIDDKHVLILDEDDADKILTTDLSDNIEIYIASDVLLSNEQKQIIQKKNIMVNNIPDYYFNPELKEVGE